ncbi:MAG TPA: hypothetical protein VJ840_16700 [Gemmatimonadaceae bacterium]|nr:hypothetical protein [Gemmatimonadaceae bacterium]
MIFLTPLFLIPLAYLVVLGVLVFKRDSRGIAFSLLCFAAFLLAGAWAITRSRASTAGIGFLFLPAEAAIGGFLGLVFARLRHSTLTRHRVSGWLALSAFVVLLGLFLWGGTKTMAVNKSRDDQQARFSAEIARDREEIKAALETNRGRERAWLDSAIRSRMSDRAFLLAALPSDSISPEVLDAVASTNDLNTTLEAIRNPNARAETLTRIYRTATYPDYFFQAIAAHHNTPPDILRELYRRPRTITGLDIWFAGNPSTPREVLSDIARKTTDRHVIAALLENTALDCATITQLSVNLMKDQNRDADNPSVARLNERLPTVCKNTPAE